MKVLELFAGSRSIGKVCDELGHRVYSSDWNEFEGIDYVVDIMDFNPDKVPFVPDVIWASPPCTAFSVASIGKHWDKDSREPKTHDAYVGLQILRKTIDIIAYYKHYNPKLIWHIENPRGMMRKMDIWNHIDHTRYTVTYCQYGDTRMKPTDIWTNNSNWTPRPPCKNGDTCHVSAPRGSRTGTQGLKGSYLRSQIPYELCKEIILSIK